MTKSTCHNCGSMMIEYGINDIDWFECGICGTISYIFQSGVKI